MSNWKLMKNTITFLDKCKMAKFVMTTNQFTNGKKVREFEKMWSEWLGAKHSLFVSSGSTANLLLVAAIIEKFGLKRGDKVLVPACTWVTNVSPIIQLGLEPIFCDVNLDNYSFDVEELKYIKKKHPDIKLVFVTHLLGNYGENDAVKKLFPKAIVIDDVCESHGVIDTKNQRVGSDSIGATFSFYFGHHMTTIEGGMVSTNDDELYDIMRMKRSHGMARESDFFSKHANNNPKINSRFLFITDGYNFRNHEICAVLGISQLKRLDNMIEKRKNNHVLFYDLMKKHEDKFYPARFNKNDSSFCFPIVSRKKETYEKLIIELNNNNIEHRPIVSGNLLAQPFLKNYKICSKKEINNVDLINSCGIYLGNNHFIGKKEIKMLEKIFESLND